MAEIWLSGGDFLADLDRPRTDVAGAVLRAVPASTAFIGLAERFADAEIDGLESAMGELVRRWCAALGGARLSAPDGRP